MDEQAISNDVLEAENIIRGLAQRMKDTSAALQTTEAARQGMEDARTALHGSAAQLDNLQRIASEALERVENATQELIQQNGKTLEAATDEMARSAEMLKSTREEIVVAARSAQQETSSALERNITTLGELQALTGVLPGKIEESISATMATLLLEVKSAHAAIETLRTPLESICSEATIRQDRSEKSLATMQGALQKQAAFLEETATFLTERLQEAHDDTSSRISDLEASLQSHLDSMNHKTTWALALLLLLLIAAGGAAAFTAKTVYHLF